MPPQSEIEEIIPCLSSDFSLTNNLQNGLGNPAQSFLAYDNLASQNEAQQDIAGSRVTQHILSQISGPQQEYFQPLVMYGMLISKIVDLKNIIQKIRNKLSEIDAKRKSISKDEDFDLIMKNFDDSVGHLKKVCENFRLEDSSLADSTLLLLVKIEKAKEEILEELQKTRNHCKMAKDLFASFYVRFIHLKKKFGK